ncbi:unnamed protein product [Heligmosomoides polygyrus]|uniref:Uncharacterized protein n=1 Tax=Heligmosomoides polygyrus TaxID=6339 RepID=A0A183FNJ1_HELPZ|nr:unnamed protein product [Heligmosomoides polygyrus]
MTVGNRTRKITAASFSFIRHHLILAAPHRSICFSLGGAIFKVQISGRCCGATVSYGTTFASVTRLRSRSFIKVTSDYDDIFRRYLCCLLIKQVPKLILGLIGATSLRSIRREEVIESLLSGDNDLHQSIVKALDASASTNSHERLSTYHTQRCYASPAYVTGLSD